ncbi:peptidyl-tRNA hydrolase, PTH1 family [Thermoactinomyces sp. DSM 45891]|uniref:aminoacyl-tRNA hydrolase n=1 Tax=Thermoactinomyces sp. DSM 45891 TaxID=1761907 RepID=UPI00091B39FC|nr:aminoacyl-tRNA hydrolase [Thermoactinomyces sp. DSM 45891]SFX40014.1 peptidyl-tRNA hydrolase, PTH1 family [Thermoactinomyces sp. DSM 45891]
MKLIVGLGNPGKKYEPTRHNIGFWAIDRLSERWGIPLNKEKWKGIIGEGMVRGEKVILLKPMTYMNLSGESIRPAMDWLKMDIEDLVIIYDEMDLPLGEVRLRTKGSAGGHNGMKSTIAHLGTDQFKRIRLGIGRPVSLAVPDYVLSPFSKEELPFAEGAADRASQAVETWVEESFLLAMNRFNG